MDRDEEREKFGHPCSKCGSPSSGGHLYFGPSVFAFIDLMQDAYHRPQVLSKTDNPPERIHGIDPHPVAVVVFFCSLAEVLFEHFLREMMFALPISEDVRKRLFSDNLSAKQRTEKLFPALTGEKWNHAIAEISRSSGGSFEDTMSFHLKAAHTRNLFLHQGNKWAIPRDMPKECLRRISPLLKLFAELHNRFVPKLYREKGRRYLEPVLRPWLQSDQPAN